MWVTSKGYPQRALRNGWEGIAWFTVTVGTDGKVKNCIITKSTGHAILDAATCNELTLRARFHPALGNDGTPIVSTYDSKMIWRIRKKASPRRAANPPSTAGSSTRISAPP
ncbi:MAG: energy transducer TonB [Novosphingobium sp.]|nr:energy transducer TonB [Novosphingobium sp.]